MLSPPKKTSSTRRIHPHRVRNTPQRRTSDLAEQVKRTRFRARDDQQPSIGPSQRVFVQARDLVEPDPRACKRTIRFFVKNESESLICLCFNSANARAHEERSTGTCEFGPSSHLENARSEHHPSHAWGFHEIAWDIFLTSSAQQDPQCFESHWQLVRHYVQDATYELVRMCTQRGDVAYPYCSDGH